jgi:hypothetical protein
MWTRKIFREICDRADSNSRPPTSCSSTILQMIFCSTKWWSLNPKCSSILGDCFGPIFELNFGTSFTKTSICGTQKMKNKFFMQRKHGPIFELNFGTSFTKTSICGTRKMKNKFFMQRKQKLPSSTLFAIACRTLLHNIGSF